MTNLNNMTNGQLVKVLGEVPMEPVLTAVGEQ